ncbi:MAG: DPP IV N-terminal domain-containing protein, partial [Chloroflexota bacterium]|nr:DPP IV N-terminal domain-containing protein [Chloroflexota bacterium]
MNERLWGRMVVLGSLVLSGLVGAAGLPRGAGVAEVEAAFPGGNGLIAYVTNGNVSPFESDIYTISPNGKKITRLTENAGANVDPAWSADGARIAFESDRDGSADVYVMNADGSGQTNLTNDPGCDSWPAWSPDGAKIAYVRCPDISIYEIWVMNDDGTGQTQLTNNGVNSLFPAWSP